MVVALDLWGVLKFIYKNILSGINAILYNDSELVVEEIKRLVPILKENGGYVFATDHSIPNSCSLETMKKIVAAAKEYGGY